MFRTRAHLRGAHTPPPRARLHVVLRRVRRQIARVIAPRAPHCRVATAVNAVCTRIRSIKNAARIRDTRARAAPRDVATDPFSADWFHDALRARVPTATRARVEKNRRGDRDGGDSAADVGNEATRLGSRARVARVAKAPPPPPTALPRSSPRLRARRAACSPRDASIARATALVRCVRAPPRCGGGARATARSRVSVMACASA